MVTETEGGFKSDEEKQAAGQFEAPEGANTETELSENVKKAVDIAWRSEGLDKVMQEKGDARAEKVALLTMTIFAETAPRNETDEAVLTEASDELEALCEEFEYDSGKRKYTTEE